MPGEEAPKAQHRRQYIQPLGQISWIETVEPRLVGGLCCGRTDIRQVGDPLRVAGKGPVEVLGRAVDHAQEVGQWQHCWVESIRGRTFLPIEHTTDDGCHDGGIESLP
jgi:hypothetical protein